MKRGFLFFREIITQKFWIWNTFPIFNFIHLFPDYESSERTDCLKVHRSLMRKFEIVPTAIPIILEMR